MQTFTISENSSRDLESWEIPSVLQDFQELPSTLMYRRSSSKFDSPGELLPYFMGPENFPQFQHSPESFPVESTVLSKNHRI